MGIRWLHLSDVHECEKDGYHRRAMYDAIVAEVRENPEKPDFVFLTGDLAYSGTAPEYELLGKRLVEPLRAVLPETCRLFGVPGNHDVDRTRMTKPRLWIGNEQERKAFQAIGELGRRKREDLLIPRFAAYRAFERKFLDWGDDWLASADGAACRIVTVGTIQLAVIGINTAWLCQDDDDWSRVTAGRYMVEAALQRAEAGKTDLAIVLGHHPIAAMVGEQEWSDGDRIRRRMEQANALYLHGHLHRAGAQIAGDSMQSVLAIQAPSGFQAADSNVWRNGLLWGEVNLDRGELIVSPRRWNDENNEYVFDSDAAASRFRVTGQDSFAFPLPGRASGARFFPGMDSVSAGLGVDGWEIIDAAALARKTAVRPSSKEMGDWFDGQFPSWETALADGVRPRLVVETIARRFETAHGSAPGPSIALLTGAGGEGKSAALLQTAGMLLRGEKQWTCLWRSASAAQLPQNLLGKLEHRPGHAWIVAIDDAESIGAGLPAALRLIQPRTDIHLVLAARDADWSIRGLTDATWSGVAEFSRVMLAGLNAEDARRIADGWLAYGPEAMGLLRDHSAAQAAGALLHHAQEQAARKEEGALLGALLITREGEDLKSRVIRLMKPWGDVEGVDEFSLLDVYAMIAAMHAENQLYMSQSVLAFALHCDESRLSRGPLRILRREAMVDSSTTYVLTRHRRIAEIACEWLTETGYDLSRWYAFLAKASRAFGEHFRHNPDIVAWQYGLVNHFIQKGRTFWPIAVAVAKALFEDEKNNPLLLTAYAGALRHTERTRAAMQLLREQATRFPGHRGIMNEWSVAAGRVEDYGLDAWLSGRALADDPANPIMPNQAKLCLAGLGAAFRELGRQTGRVSYYSAAQAACGRLGLRLPDVDPTTRGHFMEDSKAGPAPAVGDLQKDLQILGAAVIEASFETAPEHDPPFFEKLLGDPDAYRFKMLEAVLSSKRGGQSA